jgi:DNA-binding IclR family transcriptional regulator
MLDGTEVVYLDRVEAAWPLRLHFQSGSRVPAHASASGKLLLALLPARTRHRLIDSLPLQRFTPYTLTDPRALEEALKRIRKDSVSTDNEEYLAGTVCVAVPVENKERRVPAALAVHAPLTRMSLAHTLRYVPALRRAAAQLVDTFAQTDF